MRSIEMSFRATRIIRHLLLTILLVLLTSVMVFTDVEASASEPQAGKSEKVHEEAPQQNDNIDGESELPWLFAVFIITWTAFFAYIFVMSRRQREMQREIEALKRSLKDGEAATKNEEGLTGG